LERINLWAGTRFMEAVERRAEDVVRALGAGR
jgi:hypothetical protein